MKSFSLNYDTKVSTARVESIHVKIDPEVILKDYATAYSDELKRLNPIRAKEIGLTSEELYSYFKTLLLMRVRLVNGKLPEYRQARRLNIPAWIQHCISQIGIVSDLDRGLRFVPTIDVKYYCSKTKDIDAYTIDMKVMNDVSLRLESFTSDGLNLIQDGLPSKPEGNQDVMGMVIIKDYVQSIHRAAHPVSSYIAAFLGHKLSQEQAFSVLFRVRYDDINFIADQLLTERAILC